MVLSLPVYRVASFFTGVGGIDLGLELTGRFRSVYANEVDPYPAETFEENFNLQVDLRSIEDVSPKDLPDFDVLVGGFPCQAFSVAGLREGFTDRYGRGELFFEMVRIIENVKPRVAVFENVKNLVFHDNGNTMRVIEDSIRQLGYYHSYAVLNGMVHGGVPQNRERVFIVAFRDESDFEKFEFPSPVPHVTLESLVDFNYSVASKYYYNYNNFKASVVDAVLAEAVDSGRVYQWRRGYVRASRAGVSPTLTANMGSGGHNVPIVKTRCGVRRLTPRECFNLMGFPDDFVLPSQADSRLYKQAGNSVCVGVVERLGERIALSLDGAKV